MLLDAEARHVLNIIGSDPVSVDKLHERTGLASAALNVALLRLELAGRSSALPGGRVAPLASTRSA